MHTKTKVTIKTIVYDGETCYKVIISNCRYPEYFITCKEGFKLLTLFNFRLSGGDNVGYTRLYLRSGSSLRAGQYRVHNLLVINTDKSKVVDHINRNKRDNRISNLRLVSHRVNIKNSSGSAVNKYISWSNHANSYRLVIEGIHLGYFKSLPEALTYRDSYLASINHPYTP